MFSLILCSPSVKELRIFFQKDLHNTIFDYNHSGFKLIVHLLIIFLEMEKTMLKKVILLAAISGSLVGCASGLSPTSVGLITDVKGPIMATGATGSKTGTACATTTLGLINQGDASIEAAKSAGGITVVSSVDYHTKGFYPFVGETCVIVTGQ